MWRWSVSPEKAPDAAEYLDIEYVNGDPVSLNGEAMKPHRIDPKTGMYKGRQIIEVKTEE